MPCFFLSKNSPPNQLNKKTQNKYDFKYFFQHVIYYYIIYFKTLQSFINFTSQNPMHIFRSKLAAALPVNTTLRLTTASQALRIRSCTFSLNKKRGRAMKTLFHARASRYCLPEKLQPCIIPQELDVYKRQAPQMTRFIVKKFSSKSYRLDLRKALKYVKVYVYAMTVNLRQLCFARVLVTAAYLSC